MSGKNPGEERLRQLYESERLTTRQIGELYDTSKTSVVRWMRRYGIERRTNKNFDEATELAICNRYLGGESPEALGDEFGCNRNTIHAIVKRLGHDRRRDGRPRTHRCDDSYFDRIDTQEKAYWLGFVAADGGVVGNTVRVKLAAKDKEHLRRLRVSLGATNPVLDTVTKVNGEPFAQSYLTITSKRLASGLASHGVVPNKSATLEWPEHLAPDLIRHYLRGYVDGDGGFYVYPDKARPERLPVFLCTFICSPPFAAGARTYLAEAAGASRSRLIPESGGMVTVRYAGRPQVRSIYRLLYEAATLCLPRKHRVVAPYIEEA